MKPSVMKLKNKKGGADIAIIEVPENLMDSRVYMVLTPDEAYDLAQDLLTMVVDVHADLRNKKK
jgi:hypothetical protein